MIKDIRTVAITATVIAIVIVLLLMVYDCAQAFTEEEWCRRMFNNAEACDPDYVHDRSRENYQRMWNEWQRKKAAQQRQPQQRTIIVVQQPRHIYPNGTPYTDEQLAESNKTRYNESGKQQVARHVKSWRSPLQRYENKPGVYMSGFLGPVPEGPIGGPYCPPGFNCFYHYPLDPYARQNDPGRAQFQTRSEAFNSRRNLDRNYRP